MKPVNFAYARPDNSTELANILATEGDDARILAGGMSLGAMLNMRLVTPRIIVDINRVEGLDTVTIDGDVIRIGAMVRQEVALSHPLLVMEAPLLVAALANVGHYQTRSRGTVGGSIAHADPSAELPLALAVLDGKIELQSRRGKRIVATKEFFISALRTARQPEEFVAAVRVPRHTAGQAIAFREFAMRAGDYAIVACACRLTLLRGTITELRLGLAGTGDTPTLVDLSDLSGKELSEDALQAVEAATAQSIEPITDLHASSEYRRQLAVTIVRAVVIEAFGRMRRDEHVSS